MSLSFKDFWADFKTLTLLNLSVFSLSCCDVAVSAVCSCFVEDGWDHETSEETRWSDDWLRRSLRSPGKEMTCKMTVSIVLTSLFRASELQLIRFSPKASKWLQHSAPSMLMALIHCEAELTLSIQTRCWPHTDSHQWKRCVKNFGPIRVKSVVQPGDTANQSSHWWSSVCGVWQIDKH